MNLELIMLLPLVLVGVVLQFTPLLTRRGIFFSATVDPDFPKSDDGRRILRSYRWQSALWTLGALVLMLVLFPVHPTATLLPMLLVITGSCFSYWRKFREVHERFGRSVSDIRYAELSPTPAPPPFSLWFCVPPFVWIVGVAAYLQTHWAVLPEHFPVHWGADGQPNGWATRSFQGVYGPLMAALGMDAFCLLFAFALLLLSRNTTMRHVTVTILLLVMYPVSFAFGMVALLPLMTFPIWLIPAITLTFVAAILFWSVRKVFSPSARDVVPEPASDSYWKGGMFYYNPNDPAIFVSKRVGIGLTMNFAHKMTWVVLAGMLLIALLPALLLRMK
jgi:uncharacterized membrane protein